METYRSGHNENDSKSFCLHGHVGSNPTVSALFPETNCFRDFIKKNVTLLFENCIIGLYFFTCIVFEIMLQYRKDAEYQRKILCI